MPVLLTDQTMPNFQDFWVQFTDDGIRLEWRDVWDLSVFDEKP